MLVFSMPRYAGVRFTSGGRIGHRFKDQTTARIAALLFDLQYAHTDYPDHDVAWNQFLGFGADEVQLDSISGHKTVHINKNAWCGLDLSYVEAIVQNNQQEDVVFQFSESARLMLEQISKENRDRITSLLKAKYQQRRQLDPVTNYFDPEATNVALQARRGPDVDPKHRGAYATWRYTPLSYYEGIVKNLRNTLPGKVHFHFYSQGDPSDFLPLSEREDVFLHLAQPNQPGLLHQAFDHMIRADIFVTAVSAFSYMVSHFTAGAIINLPVQRVVELSPEDRVFLSQLDGGFEAERLLRYWSDNLFKSKSLR